MRPEVGAAAGGCSLFSSPNYPFYHSLSLSSPLILALLFLPPLFASPLSVCRFIIGCLLLLADLCHSSKALLCSGDRHFISALLTSWWRACVNMCVRDGSWLMGGGLNGGGEGQASSLSSSSSSSSTLSDRDNGGADSSLGDCCGSKHRYGLITPPPPRLLLLLLVCFCVCMCVHVGESFFVCLHLDGSD